MVPSGFKVKRYRTNKSVSPRYVILLFMNAKIYLQSQKLTLVAILVDAYGLLYVCVRERETLGVSIIMGVRLRSLTF